METVSEAKSDVDASKGKTLEEMSKLVVELTQKVSVKKTQLEPLIAELRPLREEHRELKNQYDQMKRVYDSTASSLENAAVRLQQVSMPFKIKLLSILTNFFLRRKLKEFKRNWMILKMKCSVCKRKTQKRKRIC